MSFLLRFAVAAILPGSAHLPAARDLGLAEFVTRFRRETTWLMWVGVMASAALFQISPLLTISVPLPAVMLTTGALDRHAAAMADHSIYHVRQAAFLLKMVGGLHWAAHPVVRERFGLAPYAPDPLTWKTS
jgi:hypothetical protein